MATSKNTLLVAMNLPTTVPEFIIKARAVYGAMIKAPYFESSKATLTELDAETIVLNAAQTGLSETPPSSTTAIRNTAKTRVKNLLRTLAGDVQSAANKNPEKAAEIIQSSSYDIRKSGGRAANENKAFDGTEEGMVILTAATPGAHEWMISYDGGATSKQLAATMNSTTIVSNLVPGKRVWFQNRAMLAGNTYGEWTAWYWIDPKVYR